MPRVARPKLVRDKIPELLMRAGRRPIFRRVKGDELQAYADQKILEEAREFARSSQIEDKIEELIDLLEIVYFRLRLEGVSAQEAHDRMARKRRERGGFEGGVVLESVQAL
ncbi:MAG: nucleoside triphosphate pyrophosphohydrolase [Candidatus Bipolaricaulota bacterium]|nr:nucleoside triphosphate pyrophosphohydrolase [Candidatus Bipolaricaulota bacterium]MDW8329469.1 nucleoside triphosphate pyrophosphohydrolase [Candidatus Bipolaricaulota bacterium]